MSTLPGVMERTVICSAWTPAAAASSDLHVPGTDRLSWRSNSYGPTGSPTADDMQQKQRECTKRGKRRSKRNRNRPGLVQHSRCPPPPPPLLAPNRHTTRRNSHTVGQNHPYILVRPQAMSSTSFAIAHGPAIAESVPSPPALAYVLPAPHPLPSCAISYLKSAANWSSSPSFSSNIA